jgi:integrase
MPNVLTTKAIERVSAAEARQEIPDALAPGLRLVVQPSGAKSWAIRYRHGGAPKKLVLGPLAPVIDGEEPTPALGLPLTLKGAREVARQQLLILAAGRDPARERQTAKRKAKEDATSDRDLVRTIVAQFLARYLKPRAKPGYYASTKAIFDKDVIPRWGERRVQDISRRDVLDLLDEVVERGAAVQANRVLAAIRKFFAWAASRDIVAVSPAAGVKPPTPETSRDRVLTDAELRLVWLGADAIGYPFGPMVRLLLLTGARRNEVAGMRRSELGHNSGDWTLPAARTKNGRAHALPLPALALGVVNAIPAVAVGKTEKDVIAYRGKRDLLFTTTGKAPVSGFARAKERLDAAMVAIARKEAGERGDDPSDVSLAPWTFHDLRRTMASGLARLGVALPVVERLLNHASGSFGGIVGVYQHHDFAEEKRAALSTWAEHIAGLTGHIGAGS